MKKIITILLVAWIVYAKSAPETEKLSGLNAGSRLSAGVSNKEPRLASRPTDSAEADIRLGRDDFALKLEALLRSPTAFADIRDYSAAEKDEVALRVASLLARNVSQLTTDERRNLLLLASFSFKRRTDTSRLILSQLPYFRDDPSAYLSLTEVGLSLSPDSRQAASSLIRELSERDAQSEPDKRLITALEDYLKEADDLSR